MKSASRGFISGCVVWVLVFGVLSSCLGLVGAGVGAATAQAGFVVETVGGRMCPPETTPDLYTYQSYTVDERGVRMPATAYELICVDPAGNTVANLGPTWAFIWSGILGAAGLLLAAILSALAAAPLGAMLGRAFAPKA